MARKTASKAQPKAAETRAGKRIVTTRDEIPLPDPEEVEQVVGDDPEEQPSELDLLVAEFGGEGFEFAVFRLDPKAPRGRSFCGPLPGSNDSFTILKNVQENYGGGNFELRVRDEGGQFLRRITVSVEAPKKPEAPPVQQMQEQVANVLKVALEPMQQIITELRARQAQPMNLESIAAKSQLWLPMLIQLRQLFVPNAAPTSTNPLAALTQMKELKDTMDSLGMGDREPDGFDRLLTLFNNFKPLLEKAAAAQLARGQRPAAPRASQAPVVAGGAPVIGAPVVGTSHAAPAPAVIPEILLPYLPMLTVAARGGETAELVAERILAVLPDEAIDPLADALEDGSLLTALLQKPEFAGLEPWLNALAKNILSGLDSAEESPGGDEGGDDVSGGNDENATGGAEEHS